MVTEKDTDPMNQFNKVNGKWIKDMTLNSYGKIVVDLFKNYEIGLREQADKYFSKIEFETMDPAKLDDFLNGLFKVSKSAPSNVTELKKLRKRLTEEHQLSTKEKENDLLNFSNLGLSFVTLCDGGQGRDSGPGTPTLKDNLLHELDRKKFVPKLLRCTSSLQNEKDSEVRENSIDRLAIPQRFVKKRPPTNENQKRENQPVAEALRLKTSSKPLSEIAREYNTILKKLPSQNDSLLKNELKESTKLGMPEYHLENHYFTVQKQADPSKKGAIFVQKVDGPLKSKIENFKENVSNASECRYTSADPQRNRTVQEIGKGLARESKSPQLTRTVDPPRRGSVQKQPEGNPAANTKEPRERLRSKQEAIDRLLTPKAREIYRKEMSSKPISSKHHAELFKMMDKKSKHYDFTNSEMGDLGVHFLSKYIKDNHDMESLVLDGCKISDDGLSLLLVALLKIRLQKLSLQKNQISRLGLTLLTEFIRIHGGIRLVNLKGNLIEKAEAPGLTKEFSQFSVVLLV
jgi:hypothetical protein